MVNVVFAHSGFAIPVEIIWNDQDASARPASVTLHVRRQGSTSNIKTVTVTNVSQGPNDPNKWKYLITGMPYNANYVYQIYHYNFNGYTVGGLATLTTSSSPMT